MTPRNWPRLADYVRERRDELGLTQEEVATRGGPSTATLRLIESAAAESYRAKSLRQLEDALGWVPGSARAILADREPHLLADSGQAQPDRTEAAPERIAPVPDSATVAAAKAIGNLLADFRADVEAEVSRARMRYGADPAGEQVFPRNEREQRIWDLTLIPETKRVGTIAWLRMMDAEEEAENAARENEPRRPRNAR